MTFYFSYKHNFYLEHDTTVKHANNNDANNNNANNNNVMQRRWWRDLILTVTTKDIPQTSLSLTMRIVAIECGFLLDSMLHVLFNM
jgi:hypothetical protein